MLRRRLLAPNRTLLRRIGRIGGGARPAQALRHSGCPGETWTDAAPVLLEPCGFGETMPEAPAALRDIPGLVPRGDVIDQDARWPAIRRRSPDLRVRLRGAGGCVDVVLLPERGIPGNLYNELRSCLSANPL